MTGSTNLTHLLAAMEPVLSDDVLVFATMGAADIPETISPVMVFNEAEGTTLILKQDEAKTHGIDYEFPCRMITLNIHSSLDAVGFLAVITTHLAALDVGVNPVSGFFHDHLFIPHERAHDVMATLEALSATHAEKSHNS